MNSFGDVFNPIFPYPESAVIFLTSSKNQISSYKPTISFNGKYEMKYEVIIIRLLNMSIEEIVERGLTFFLPLYMLKYRDAVDRYMRSLTDPSIHVRKGTKELLQKNCLMI
jgi:hypothetical protein